MTSFHQFNISCEMTTNNKYSQNYLTPHTIEPIPISAELDVEDMLDTVVHVVDDNDCSNLSPTPIGPLGINVVNEVRLSDMPLFQKDDMVFTECLSPLLQKTLEETRTTTKLLSNWSDNNYSLDYLLKEQRRGSIDKFPNAESFSNSSTTSSDESTENLRTIRSHHSEQWNVRYRELVDFQRTYGHCLVPNYWEENPRLALWVKRQRYQHKRKKEGQHSTMREEREEKLEQLGFVWDSHGAMWEERLNELRSFKEVRGHCNVPANYPKNRQLAIWVKCQRRQYRLYCDGQQSHMTPERISKLVNLGFVWHRRNKQKSLR